VPEDRPGETNASNASVGEPGGNRTPNPQIKRLGKQPITPDQANTYRPDLVQTRSDHSAPHTRIRTHPHTANNMTHPRRARLSENRLLLVDKAAIVARFHLRNLRVPN
jgi:hypothetical protein